MTSEEALADQRRHEAWCKAQREATLNFVLKMHLIRVGLSLPDVPRWQMMANTIKYGSTARIIWGVAVIPLMRWYRREKAIAKR